MIGSHINLHKSILVALYCHTTFFLEELQNICHILIDKKEKVSARCQLPFPYKVCLLKCWKVLCLHFYPAVFLGMGMNHSAIFRVTSWDIFINDKSQSPSTSSHQIYSFMLELFQNWTPYNLGICLYLNLLARSFMYSYVYVSTTLKL